MGDGVVGTWYALEYLQCGSQVQVVSTSLWHKEVKIEGNPVLVCAEVPDVCSSMHLSFY